LERRKLYEAIADSAAAKRGLIKIIDESGEAYLYPESMFVASPLPAAVRGVILPTGRRGR
jgi:hypothetical protein